MAVFPVILDSCVLYPMYLRDTLLWADVLLTTDDRLLKRARRYGERIQVPISNPVTWLMDALTDEGDEGDDTD
jgi:hypothetical protein